MDKYYEDSAMICDVCAAEMEPFDDHNYYCPECGRHGYLFDDGRIEYDEDEEGPDWSGKDDIDWDDVFDE